MKKMISTVAVVCCVFGISAFAQSNQKPANMDSSQPLSGADIALVKENGAVLKTVHADQQGRFVFSDVQPGTYILKVSVGKGATVVSPRDVATGQASGKQQAATTNTVTGEESGDDAKRINTSRSNIKTQKAAPSTESTSSDQSTGSEATPQNKAGVSTSRSNIRNRTATNLNVPENEEVIEIQLTGDVPPDAKRAFVLPHILEKSGLTVQVGSNRTLTGNVLKTRHETAKNAIGNIR